MPPTLRLIERRGRLARLAPDEVAHLVGHHRATLSLTPTPRRHVWRVTPAGVVGVLLTPRRRFVIYPKVPLRNLLCDDAPDDDRASPDDGPLDLLAGLLAARMLARARAGLHRAYRQTPTQGTHLVGPLDLPAQLRQSPFRKDQLHGRLDDLTPGLACNLVPRRLAGMLTPFVGPDARAALEQAAAAFAEVPDGPLTAELLAGLDAADTPDDYRPLVGLCRLLADARAASAQAGATPAPAVLLSLERLFERHVIRAVADEFGPAAHAQATHAVAGSPALVYRPDAEVRDERGARLVIDAKWKAAGRESLHNEDVYQILAYCVLLGCPRGVLVYPGRRRTWRHATPSGVTVEVRTVDVSGDRAGCLAARRRLGRSLARG